MFELSLQNTLALTFVGALVVVALLWLGIRHLLKRPAQDLLPDQVPLLPKLKSESVDGFDVFYIRQGKGPVVLFLHGIGASSFTWRYQIPSLSREFTVIAPDLPGFGRSTKSLDFQYSLDNMSQFLLKFMDQLKVRDFYVVGSSMGGTIGLNMCRMAPHRIRKVTLLAPASQPQLVPKGVDRLSWVSPWAQSFITETTMASIMGRVNANPAMITDYTIKTVLEPFMSSKDSIAVFLKATRIIRDKRLPGLFENLQTDSMILYGSKDKMVPQWAMKKLSKILHAPLHSHPDAGHHPQEDEHEWVNGKIRDFFTSDF